MKFNDAFNNVFDRENKRSQEAGEGELGFTPATTKILAMAWNICAEAGGKFDDFVYVDKKNNIVSIPIAEEEKTEKPSKKAGNGGKINESGTTTES